MVNYAPVYLITDPDLFLNVLIITRFYISDRLLGCQERPLLESYA